MLETRSDLNSGHQPWGKNDALFRSEAREGHKWASFVADRLAEQNVSCRATELEFAADEADRERFINEQDIVLLAQPGVIEVKSRRLKFSAAPKSYPYATAFVDTVTGWEKKSPKPLAVVLVSQQTSDMLVVPVSTHGSWSVTTSFDRVRKINERWYTVPSSLLRPFSELTDWLTARQSSFTTGAPLWTP